MRLYLEMFIVYLLIQNKVVCAAVNSTVNSKGVLVTSFCDDATDCHVSDKVPSLALACYYNQRKCHCSNTFTSDYTLEVVGHECLMSKYGPCGNASSFSVGCRDGFSCVNGRCRDPADSLKIVKSVFEFPGSCSRCKFADDLDLECKGYWYGSPRCLCRKVDIPDISNTFWDLRNYDGNKNCSVGLYGPCGIKNGIKIDCHGNGIICVSGRCVNGSRPTAFSARGESCALDMDCAANLVCSYDYECITPKSKKEGQRCSANNQCAEGFECGFDRSFDSFNPSVCVAEHGILALGIYDHISDYSVEHPIEAVPDT